MIINIMAGGGRKYSGKVLVATVNVIYPVGSVCTCKNMDTGLELIASDKSGTFSFQLPTKGTWKVLSTNNLYSTAEETIQIDSLGGVHNITLEYFSVILNVTYPVGSVCTCTNGSITLNAPDKSGTAVFDIPVAGTWKVISSNSESIYSYKEQSIQATSTGTVQNITLKYFAATITVYVPPRSVCICESEELTYKYDNSEDIVVTTVFTVPRTGKWYMTATDGENEKIEIVEITSDGQSLRTSLVYARYLYSSNPSNQYSDVTGGWTCSITDNHGDLTFTDNYMQLYVYAYLSEISGWSGTVYTKNPVTILGNTLEFVLDTGWNRIGISSTGSNNWDDYLVTKINPSAGTHTINVSNFLGQDVYICASASAGSNWGTAYDRIISIRNY